MEFLDISMKEFKYKSNNYSEFNILIIWEPRNYCKKK